MKHLLLIALALVLTGCAGLAPAAPTPAPTATPQVVVQTVIVTVLVTEPATETPIPSPTLTPIPTFTPQPTDLTAAEATGTAAATPGTPAALTSPTATLPDNAGGGLFTDLTRSSDHFALSCQPDTITFSVSTTDGNVSEVDLFYRMENQTGTSVSGWIDIGKMTSDQNGNFTMDFKASLVDPDLRARNSWFDYQFVGLSKAGVVLGRSAKITKQITYMLDCAG